MRDLRGMNKERTIREPSTIALIAHRSMCGRESQLRTAAEKVGIKVLSSHL